MFPSCFQQNLLIFSKSSKIENPRWRPSWIFCFATMAKNRKRRLRVDGCRIRRKKLSVLKNTWLRVDGTQVEFIRYKNAFHFSVSGKGVKNWFWLFCFGEFFVVVISMLIHELIVRSRSARTVFPQLITECSHRS